MLKKAARRISIVISWAFAGLYIRKYKPIIIGVTGSVGKTGTKRAIAHVLSSEHKVSWQDGNYNDIVTVPLVFFSLDAPPLFNPIAWLIVYLKMSSNLLFGEGSEIVVLELGTDGPGQIEYFGKYLKLDYAVITAISHEHMEYFQTLQAVAHEEMSVMQYSNKTYVSESVAKSEYVAEQDKAKLITYGKDASNSVRYSYDSPDLVINSQQLNIKTKPQLVGTYQFAALAVAAEIAANIGVTSVNIIKAISTLQSMSGRMKVLQGKNNTMIIDDTYNSSPVAVAGALTYLYGLPHKNKIAVLGNMNEMGNLSKNLHENLVENCDSNKLDLLITIGKDINEYLAPLAREKGIDTRVMTSPYEIGEFLSAKDYQDTAILFKGSQNGVFLEEAIKPLLLNPSDSNKLVRQSDEWLRKKQEQFNRVNP